MEYSKIKIAVGFVILVLVLTFCMFKTHEMIKETEIETAKSTVENIYINGNKNACETKCVKVEMNRFASIEMTDEERHMLCDVIYDLAGGKSQVEQRRICEIVFNRVLSDKFPNTVKCVIDDMYPCAQFEYVSGQGGEFQEKIIDVVYFDEPLTRFDYYYY